MLDGIRPPGNSSPVQAAPILERTTGISRVRVAAGGRIAELYQEGALRMRPTRGPVPPEVIAINTAGGLTGHDRIELVVNADAGACAVVTTPACEKIYRSADGVVTITNSVTLGAASRLDWLPQPMIVFDGARLVRRLDLDMAPDAAFLGIEGCILGRTAMNESVRTGAIHDAWRVRRGGTLVFADAFRLAGDIHGASQSGATLGGARAFATLIYAAPDAESRLDLTRQLLETASGETGASAWNGVLAVRFLTPDGQELISNLAAFLSAFRDTPLPRSWLC